MASQITFNKFTLYDRFTVTLREIIEDHNFVVQSRQMLDHVRAYITRPSDNKNIHQLHPFDLQLLHQLKRLF